MGLPPLVWHVRTGHTLATLSRAYGTLENYCFAVSGTLAMWFHVVSLQRVLAFFSNKKKELGWITLAVSLTKGLR